MTSPSIPPDDGMNDLRSAVAGVYQDPTTPTTPQIVAPNEGVEYWSGVIQAGKASELEQFGTSMRAAIKANPETAGLADTLARKMGMPLLKAQDDMGFLRAVSVMQRMRDDNIRSTSPVLYKSFQGLEFARKALDDYDALSWGESWARGWKSGGLTAERGRLAAKLWLSGGLEWDQATGSYKQSATDRMQRREDLARLEQVQVEQAELGPITGFIGNAAQIAGQWADAVPRAVESGYKTAAVTGAASLLAGPASPVATPAATVGGFAFGFSAQYTADTFASMTGNAYADMVAAGYDPDRALVASVAYGIAGTALELGGLNIATSAVRQKIMGAVWKRAATEVATDVPSGFVRGYLGEYGKVIAAETGTELAQEFGLIIAEQLARRGGEADMNQDGVASRLWEVASATVQGMALLGLPAGIAGGVRGKVQSYQKLEQERAQAQRDHLKAAQGINPKMLERDPEAAADFMRQALRQGDGPQEAHLDAETFRTLLDKIDTEGAKSGVLRKSTLDVLEGIVPGISKQLEDAEATGGDVSLPVADIITRIRGELPEFELAFSEVARLDPQAPDADSPASNPFEKDPEWTAANRSLDVYAEDSARLPLTYELVGYVGSDSVGKSASGEFRRFSAQEQKELSEKRKDRAFRDSEREQAKVAWDTEKAASEADTGSKDEAAFYTSLREIERQTAASVVQAAGTRISPSQAQNFARAYSARLEVMAKEDGIDPAEAQKRYGTAFKADTTGTVVRGRMLDTPEGIAIVFGPQATVDTALHELTHAHVKTIEVMDAAGSAYGKAQLDNLLAHWKMTREQWAAMDLEQRRPLLEDIAYNAEEYFASGQAPSAELRGVFQKLRSFIVGVYGAVRNYLVGAYAEETGGAQLRAISPELRSFFDRMLAADSAIEIEVANRAGAARLSDEAAKAIGVDAETLAEIRAKEQEVVEDAKEALTSEAVRAGRFFAAGRRNAEASVKRKLAESKARIRKEVEASMADSPVQAAFQYFRDGLVDKNDGTRVVDQTARKLDVAAVRDTLGLPPVKGGKKGKSMVARIRELGGIRMDSFPGDMRGEFNIPGVFRKNGGESWESIARQLAGEGYGGEVYSSDVADAADNSWLVDALADATNGVAIYPAEFVSDSQRMQSEYEDWVRSQSAEADDAVRASRRDAAEREALFTRLARRRLLQTDGIRPSDAAPLFSFNSGEQMLRALADAPLREEAIRRETLQRLEAEEPLSNPKEFKRAVEEALHGKSAARLASTILRAMLGDGVKSSPQLEAEAREAARLVILRTPVGRINVRSFANAELRAMRARDKAIKSGDKAAAIEAMRRYLVQHYLTVEGAKAEREIERETATIAKRFEQPVDKLKDGRNLDVVQVAISMLGKFGMVSAARHNAAVEYLSEWARLDPNGYKPYAVRLGMLVEAAVPMEQMTLDRFRVVTEAASGFWSEAKQSNYVRSRGKLVLKQQAQSELLDEVVDTFGKEDGSLPDFRPEEMTDWSMGAILANLTRLEAWTIKMDGGEPGAWHRYVYQPLKDAAVSNEVEKITQHKWAADIMARHDAIKPLAGEEIDLQPVLGQGRNAVFKNRGEFLGALQHIGTEKGLRNLIIGNKLGTQPMPGATYDEQFAAALPRFKAALQYAVDKGWLFEADFKLLQEQWDHIRDTIKDRLFTTTRDVWGFYPTEEKAQPFETPFGTIPGGYFPSKVDKRKSAITADKQLSAIEQGAQDFRAAHASVPRGMTIKRGENVVQPRVTDIRLLTQHIDEALNIIHLQPALSDVAGLFRGNVRSNEQLGMLREAMAQVAPFAERKIILPALERMARDSIVAPGDAGLAKTIGYVRQSTSMGFLGFNPKNAALQFTGLANAVPQVGMGRLWGAFWSNWASPSKLVASIEEQSDAMRARWSAELQLLAQDMDRMLEPSALNDVRRQAAKAAFFLQRYAQMTVDALVWQAAHDKATAEGSTADDAVTKADSAVRITQGEKSPLDVSQFLAGGAVAQLFTQFADYPNTVLNQNLAAPEGRRFAVFAWTVIAPALATSMIGWTMAFGKLTKGERDDDDEYGRELLNHFVGDQVRGAFGLLPVAGPIIGSALNELFGLTNTPGGMRNTPFAGWSMVDTIYRIGSGRGGWSDWIMGAGLGLRLPVRPAASIARYEQNVAAGREEDGGALDYLRVLLVGR